MFPFFSPIHQKLSLSLSRTSVHLPAAACKVGKRIVLPSSYPGSPRAMQQNYLDAMALVRKYGRPDFFITMTANPNWPEIKNSLAPGESAADRPDLVARVFRLKADALLHDILKKGSGIQ